MNRLYSKEDGQTADNRRKGGSTPVKEVQIKVAMSSPPTTIRTTTRNIPEQTCGQDVKKLEASCIIRGNTKWRGHLGRQYGGSYKKLKVELPYDAAILLLGIYPKGLQAETLKRDLYAHVYISIICNALEVEANASIHRWMREEIKCGLYVEWAIIRP